MYEFCGLKPNLYRRIFQMKKILLVMLAVLMLTFSVAFAQETQTVNEINWTDIEAAVAESGISGDFFAISDLGVMMWIPEVLSEVELDDEDVEDGYICILATEDGEAGAMVFYEDAEGLDLEGLMAGMSEVEGITELEMGIINGIPALTYSDTENDAMSVVFMSDKGNAVAFTFFPMSDEGFAQIASIMAASIQPVED